MTTPRSEGPRWLEFESWSGWVDPAAVKRDRASRLATLALQARRRRARGLAAVRRWMREAGL
jgi:hypothetical protein